MPKAKKLGMPICAECNSKDVLVDAWASWSVEDQKWELDVTFDNSYCAKCDGECKLEWIETDKYIELEDDEDDNPTK